MIRAPRAVAQAFVELRAEDPEAVSALGVARAHLEAGRGLLAVRRLRVLELKGNLPGREELEALLHRSTQFYNPAKERCTVRVAESDPVPAGEDEWLVLVSEREGERRPAAERWWRHETGARVDVREGVMWGLRFEQGAGDRGQVEDLAVVRGRRHGLFCNPQSQQWRMAAGRPPLPWVTGRGRKSA